MLTPDKVNIRAYDESSHNQAMDAQPKRGGGRLIKWLFVIVFMLVAAWWVITTVPRWVIGQMAGDVIPSEYQQEQVDDEPDAIDDEPRKPKFPKVIVKSVLAGEVDLELDGIRYRVVVNDIVDSRLHVKQIGRGWVELSDGRGESQKLAAERTFADHIRRDRDIEAWRDAGGGRSPGGVSASIRNSFNRFTRNGR